MSLYTTFATSPKKELEGAPIRFPKNSNGTIPTFFIAHAANTNPAFVAAIEKLQKKLQMVIDLDVLTAADADPAMREVFLDVLLRGWENVYAPGEDGQEVEVPYSRATAEKLFDDLPSLYFTLMAEARKLANYRAAELENLAGKH